MHCNLSEGLNYFLDVDASISVVIIFHTYQVLFDWDLTPCPHPPYLLSSSYSHLPLKLKIILHNYKSDNNTKFLWYSYI